MNLSQLNQPTAVIQYPSLVQWLADRMVGAIAAHQESALHPQCDSSSDWMALPLFKGDRTFGTFSSPLLLQWLKGAEPSRVQALGKEVLDIFKADGTMLKGSALAPPAPQSWGEITEDLGNVSSLGGQQCKAHYPLPISPKLGITPTGWLYAKFSPDDLITWLQSLITAKPIVLPCNSSSEISNINPKISSDPVLFNLQHAHARCHSLLHLARQEKLLPLEDLAHYFKACGPSLWQTKHGALYLHTQTEQAILSALMQFPQALSSQKVIYGCAHPPALGYETRVIWPLPSKHLYKQAIAWSQLFYDFHRDCRLFGTVQKETPQVALARFALIAILKNVLTFLLEDIFQITAPLAL